MKTIALIATRKGLFSLDNNHQLTEVGFIGDPVSMILASSKHRRWYAALDLGHFGVKFHRSDDQGKNWEEVTTPSYPKVKDKEKGDSLKLIWSLEFADKNDPNKLWAGTIPGGLFYSSDGGHSWELNQPLWKYKLESEWFGGGFDEPGIHSICIDPRNSDEVKVAISCGGVWKTSDGGVSWESRAKGMRAEYMPPEQAFEQGIQDPHRMVQCSTEPDKLWVQHHNGIFRSIDNAETWIEFKDVKPATFGFATVVDPNNGDAAWFVPGVKDENRVPVDGQLVVTHTQNGGESFKFLNDGLPVGKSYDLVFRHSLDIDSSGNKLLMGSTTGNLWISENRGKAWQSISNYLPPIYAVRFV